MMCASSVLSLHRGSPRHLQWFYQILLRHFENMFCKSDMSDSDVGRFNDQGPQSQILYNLI